MRVFLLPSRNLLVAKCQHPVEKKHENLVYWPAISLKRNKIWLLLLYTLALEKHFWKIKFLHLQPYGQYGFSHLECTPWILFFSFDLFLSHCISYFIWCTALPSGVWINLLAVIKSVLSFPFPTNKMPHFFILQLQKRQKKWWISRSMRQTQHICK